MVGRESNERIRQAENETREAGNQGGKAGMARTLVGHTREEGSKRVRVSWREGRAACWSSGIRSVSF